MAKDAALQTALEHIASTNPGLIIDRLNSREVSEELGIDIGRSPNPIYRFQVQSPGEAAFEAVAFTLILNAANRPATRAEALGQAIAAAGAGLFKRNPLLLILDYPGNRFMAVSAGKLFGAFADEAEVRLIPASDTSYFSLTPSFERQTITMYATVAGADIWRCDDINALSAAELIDRLRDIRADTAAVDQAKIIAAVKARITTTASSDLEGSQPTLAGISMLPVGSDVPAEAEGEGEILLSPRIWRMIITAIRSSPAVILVGPPGTGKTALLRQAIRQLSTDPDLVPEGGVAHAPLWATPDESWTARDLVGGDTVVAGEIAFRPGWVLRAIAEDRWLVLDEANRADMDRIFGGLLTWLAGGRVAVGSENGGTTAREIQLGWTQGPSRRDVSPHNASITYFAGDNWRLLGTYNALDAQRVFRFGQALGRRFVRVPIPAVSPELFRSILVSRSIKIPATLLTGVSDLYEVHYQDEATLLGPALFLSMCEYLKSAILHKNASHEKAPLLTEEPPTPSSAPEYIESATEDDIESSQDILSEAYVVHVGTWLAQLEETDFEALKQRSLTKGIFAEGEWAWISSMLSSLA